jgi:hypothetical protein
MTETTLGNQPPRYRPPTPPKPSLCVICRRAIPELPDGWGSGACAGMTCMKLESVTADRLSRYSSVVGDILAGRLLYQRTGEAIWFKQKPLKPVRPYVRLQDSGEPYPDLDWLPTETVQEIIDERAGFVVSDGDAHIVRTRGEYDGGE